MTEKPLHLKASGEVTEVFPANGNEFSLAELQGFVGGYIEIIRTPAGAWMVVNEEGHLDGAAFNERATRCLVSAGELSAMTYPIVGDVLWTPRQFIK